MFRTLGNVLLGAAAGAAATWVMGKATTALLENEDPGARMREEIARGGETAYALAAGRVGEALGYDLSGDQREQVGQILHYATGIGAGAVYGALAPRVPGSGLALGLLLFAGIDEGLNAAMGLPPRRFPWQAHARGLAGHLIYGASTELALRATRTAGRQAWRWVAEA